MLRVNLLPPYIYDKQKKVRWAAVWAVVVVGVIGAFIAAASSFTPKINELQEADSHASEMKTEYDNTNTQISNVQAKIADTQAKQDFIANAQKYNNAWPAVYEEMRDLTSYKILLHSMALGPDHKTISLTGFAPSELDIVRWWMILRNNKDKFERVQFTLPSHPYTPAANNGANLAMGGNPMMRAAMYGGGGFGAGGSGAGMMQQMMQQRMMAQGGGKGMGSMGMMGPGMGMGGGGGGGLTGQATPTEVEGRQGLNFSAVVVLKDPLAGGIPTPAWPPGGGGGAGGMGGMGMGGTFAGGAGNPGAMMRQQMMMGSGGMAAGMMAGGKGTQ